MEITKREVIASICIVAFMLCIGFLISGKISDWENDKNAKYRKAIQITDTDIFQHGMETNLGNAFVYGDLEAVDTVSYPEISGKYFYIEKVKEEYTMHTRRVSHTTTVNGKTHTYYTTETYWTWDEVDREEKKAKEIKFCGVVFPIEKIKIPGTECVDTINKSGFVRYKYYGTGTKFKGTIFTDLRNNTITKHSKFYENSNIEKTLESCVSEWEVPVFWVAWIFLIIVVVTGFYLIDNKWLE